MSSARADQADVGNSAVVSQPPGPARRAAASVEVSPGPPIALRSAALDIADWRMTIEIDGETVDATAAGAKVDGGQSLTFSLPAKDPADGPVVWRVRIRTEGGSVVVESTIDNRRSQPIRLGKVSLLVASEVRFGPSGADVVVLPTGPGRAHRLDDPDLPLLAKTCLQMVDRSTGQAANVSFLTFHRANTEITYEVNRGGLDGGASATMRSIAAYCDFEQWELAAGAQTESEVLQISTGGDPFAQLEQWAEESGRRVEARIWPDAPIGYCGGAWVDTINGQESYEDVTLATLDAINTRLAGLGVGYVWTSIRNLEGGHPGNWLTWNPRSLPSGRDGFIEKTRSKGFKQGFWVGPFYVSDAVPDLIDELEGALLTGADGEKMIVHEGWPFGDAGRLPYGERPKMYALDPSHPKALEFIRRVFETYREWGIRYFMVDFLRAGAGSISWSEDGKRFRYTDYHDRSLVPSAEVYSNFIRVMKAAAGEETYLLASTGPRHHNAGLLDATRVGPDFGEGRQLAPGAFFFPAMFVINRPDVPTGPIPALRAQAANYHMHRRLFLTDSGNLLTVDKPIPLGHARAAATIHALSGGGTMLGDDIRTISDDRLSLIRKTLPRSRDVATPLDLFDSPAPEGPRTFWRHVESAAGEYEVVALYNLSPTSWTTRLDFGRLGIPQGQECLLWEFWNEESIGRATAEIELEVPANSVKVVRITPNPGRPAVIGTDMHVLMGEVDLAGAAYDEGDMSLTISACRPAHDTGTVFVWAPDTVHVKNFDGLHIARDGRDRTLVIGVPLRFDADGQAERTIEFGLLSEVARGTVNP